MKTKRGVDESFPRVVLGVASLYAPFAWLLLMDYPWDSYRLLWIRMWPVLPGLPVGLLPAVHQHSDDVGYLIMGMTTALILAPLLIACRRGWLAAIIASVVVALLSGATSLLAYGAFLM